MNILRKVMAAEVAKLKPVLDTVYTAILACPLCWRLPRQPIAGCSKCFPR